MIKEGAKLVEGVVIRLTMWDQGGIVIQMEKSQYGLEARPLLKTRGKGWGKDWVCRPVVVQLWFLDQASADQDGQKLDHLIHDDSFPSIIDGPW